MPQKTVALRERGRLAALLRSVLRQARRQPGWREPDRRNTRTWRQFVLGVVVAHSTRLVTVSQVLFGQRAAARVKAVALGLASFLTVADFPAEPFRRPVLEAGLRHLAPARVAASRGQAVGVLDPTEYPKRSRGRSERGRPMPHVGRVRKPAEGGERCTGGSRAQPHAVATRATEATEATEAKEVATTTGYGDVRAGLVLKGKQVLPLARQLFSNRRPDATSQNRVEEAVLAAVLALLGRLTWAAIGVADRGLGRKEPLVALLPPGRGLTIRIDPDITVHAPDQPGGIPLAPLLAHQPDRGEVVWDRGQEGPLPGRARTVTAASRYSRSGRQADDQEATVPVIQLVPRDGTTDPLVRAPTLPVATLADVQGVVRVDAVRWAIGTGFETRKAWGLGRFMLRPWQAIDRLLWLVAVADALLVAAARDGPLVILREQAVALLKRLAVLGRRLTVGKLAEAIGLDFHRHRRAWTTVWLTSCAQEKSWNWRLRG